MKSLALNEFLSLVSSGYCPNDVTGVSGVTGSGNWCYVGHDNADRVEITGTQGRIEFEFFAESPLRLVTADGVQEIALPNPQHVQQPLIQTIVDDLNGQGVCTANAEAALRTTAVVDRILASFRRRAA